MVLELATSCVREEERTLGQTPLREAEIGRVSRRSNYPKLLKITYEWLSEGSRYFNLLTSAPNRTMWKEIEEAYARELASCLRKQEWEIYKILW